MKKSFWLVPGILVLCVSLITAAPAQDKIHWGSESVPEEWNGTWPDAFLTVPEKTGFEKTASHYQILEYLTAFKWNTEYMHDFNMLTTDLHRNVPVVVLANPRVTSPEEARASGKTVVYLQGGIHPGECEGKEALLMLMRDILMGEKTHWLDEMIIIICPHFNVDGTESWEIHNGLPKINGTRHNAQGYDINRDAIKLETTNMRGAYQNLLNTWDPVIMLDTHRMGGARHGYAIAYATCTVPAAHPGPREYVTHQLFPAVRQGARENWGLEIFYHAGLDNEWPPTEFHHDRGAWTTEGKFMVSGYGLRNRMAVLVETSGYLSFEKKIYSQYVYANELLEYVYQHGDEMQAMCRKADEDVVNQVITRAGDGNLMNYVAGRYESAGKVDVYAYPQLVTRYLPGTSVRLRGLTSPDEKPELCRNVDLFVKPAGTKEAAVPRGYLIPAELDFIAEKLRTHNITVDVLDKPMAVSGLEFVVDEVSLVRKGGYEMTELGGGFFSSERRVFPAGTYHVDMAQPLANLAFYCLEPEVGDGFAGWNLLNEHLLSRGVGEHSVVYPIYKYFKVLEED